MGLLRNLSKNAIGQIIARFANDKDVVLAGMETGFWTPSLVTSGTQFTTVTYSSQVGFYVKMGNIVFVAWRLTWTGTTGSPTGSLNMGGFPYNASSSLFSALQTMAIGEFSNIDVNGAGTRHALGLEMQPGTKIGIFAANGDNIISATVDPALNGGATTRDIINTGFYIVD